MGRGKSAEKELSTDFQERIERIDRARAIPNPLNPLPDEVRTDEVRIIR
jgi:hypothetical protein